MGLLAVPAELEFLRPEEESQLVEELKAIQIQLADAQGAAKPAAAPIGNCRIEGPRWTEG